MPSMYEIYENHADEYDELVRYEDHRGNLKRTLHTLCDFAGKSVIEFGVGTGRVTRTYIEEAATAQCFDRSRHMMSRAENKLRDFSEKLKFSLASNMDIAQVGVQGDIFIEGWAFGHTVYDDPDNYPSTIERLVSGAESSVKPGGSVIFIETMGSNCDEPSPPGELLGRFYDILEKEYEFRKTVISTDYQFPSVEAAKRICGFFFGEGIIPEIEKRNSSLIPEFTGIWTKNLPAPGRSNE